MGRKNSWSDKDSELKELITQYEDGKKEGKLPYLDGCQLADIVAQYSFDKRFEEAQEAIDYGSKLHPENIELQIEQIYLYLDTEQIAKAEECAQTLPDSYSPDVKLIKIEICLAKDDLEGAKAIEETFKQINNQEVLFSLVTLYLQAGYPEEGITLLESYQGDEEDEEYLNILADCMCNANKREEANRIFNKLIDKDPYNPVYWMGIAKNYFINGENEKAIEALDFALAADDTFTEAIVMKGHCFLQLGNMEKALEYYQAAQNTDILPEGILDTFLGICYVQKEEWRKANEAFDKAIQYYTRSHDEFAKDVYYYKLTCVINMKKFKESHQICKLLKEWDPGVAEPYMQDARTYILEEKVEEAQKEWKKALKIAPDAETWMLISEAYQEVNMIKEAYRCLKKVKELTPNHPGIDRQLALAAIFSGDREGFFKYNVLTDSPVDLEELYDELQQIDSLPEDMLFRVKNLIDNTNNNQIK